MTGRTAYKNQWVRDNCDRVLLILKKGEKEVIKECAARQSKSLNAFIVEAIREKMERETGK